MSKARKSRDPGIRTVEIPEYQAASSYVAPHCPLCADQGVVLKTRIIRGEEYLFAEKCLCRMTVPDPQMEITEGGE